MTLFSVIIWSYKYELTLFAAPCLTKQTIQLNLTQMVIVYTKLQEQMQCSDFNYMCYLFF